MVQFDYNSSMIKKDKQLAFLPFHAVNQYMLAEYKRDVVQTALSASDLPRPVRANLDKWLNKVVKVPGFRKGAKAPARIQIKPTLDAFEKNPDLVSAVLSAWGETRADLREQMYEILKTREWEELLPANANRTKLPGFFPSWPEEEDYDAIIAAYREAHPDADASDYDISLMAVWVSMRLPFENMNRLEEDNASVEE